MQRISDLLEKYKKNALTPAEWDELVALAVNDGELEALIQQDLESRWGAADAIPEPELEAALTRVLAVDAPVKRKIVPLRRYWAAAAVLLALGFSAYWLMQPGKDQPTKNIAQAAPIQPGRNGAILILADGSQVSLDTVKNGVIALQGGATVKVVNSNLIYEGKGSNIMYNTMATPKGRQYSLTLPDGSKVWLNAASSIRYPLAFNGADRTVEITGEAYFEVAEDASRPFHVNVNSKEQIRVLGTHFNVNAYSNETAIHTTLLQGSIQVVAGERSVILKPGQQARVKDDVKVVNDADVEKVMAWKNGLFNFEDVTLAEAMRQLERWYDIEIVYEKNVPDIVLSGKMTLGVTLNELIVVLKELGVRCKLEGKKLIVLP